MKFGKFKIVSFFVKCVWGVMVCYIIENCLIDFVVIKDFIVGGYVYDLDMSNDNIIVFVWVELV